MRQASPKQAPAPVKAPSVPSAPVAVGGTDIVAMQLQLSDLSIQLTALQAQKAGLDRQLSGMRLDNPARAGVQQQQADVGTQIAQVEGRIAELKGRIGQVNGVPAERISQTGTVLPPGSTPPFRRGADPDMIVGMSFVLAMCFVLPISVSIARRIWRGRPAPTAPRQDEIAPRLDRLEHAVESIAIEIERVSEGQRFVTRILAERPAQSQAAVGEAQPVLALGAGAAEPVRVNDGQAVKQGIDRR